MHVTGERLSYKAHLPNKGCVIRDKTMYLTDEYALTGFHLGGGGGGGICPPLPEARPPLEISLILLF